MAELERRLVSEVKRLRAWARIAGGGSDDALANIAPLLFRMADRIEAAIRDESGSANSDAPRGAA